MNPDQLHAYLATNPGQSFAALGDNALILMHSQLRAGPGGFTEQQREWLAGFYLVLPSAEALETIAAKLPPSLGLNAQATLDGDLVLPASLLTDCMGEGDTWHAIAADLAGLTIMYLEPSAFPQSELMGEETTIPVTFQ